MASKPRHTINRRKFIRDTAVAAVALTVGSSVLGMSRKMSGQDAPEIFTGFTGFEQKPLPYSYDALETIIDATTMDIHYNKHAAAYAKNLREAALAESVDMKEPLEKLLAVISRYSVKMRNNAGGHFNHELFWQCMKPMSPEVSQGNLPKPQGLLFHAMERDFGSWENCKSKFSDAAKNRFGSGWAWLYLTSDKHLAIGSTPNQDNPLMDISEIRGVPLLGLDVWEHAYYLKYQNKRADYISNWWSLVNWDYVEQRFIQS